MPPYDDWNRLDDEEDEELQDSSVSRLCSRVAYEWSRVFVVESCVTEHC